jgi:hypothetical protein
LHRPPILERPPRVDAPRDRQHTEKNARPSEAGELYRRRIYTMRRAKPWTMNRSTNC